MGAAGTESSLSTNCCVKIRGEEGRVETHLLENSILNWSSEHGAK